MASEDRTNAEHIYAINARLAQIGALMVALRSMSLELEDDRAPCLQALAEKAGWLADRCIEQLDGAMVCGDFSNWAAPHGEVPESDENAQS